LTTPARLLLDYIPDNAVLQVRNPDGSSAYMAEYALILRLIDVGGVEGVGSRSGRIRYLRFTAPAAEVHSRLAERDARIEAEEQARKRRAIPSPESRFSLKFTYREQVGDTRMIVLKRVTKDGRYVTWRGCGFDPRRFNPDAIPEPLRRF
jgi:hypothetical protein